MKNHLHALYASSELLIDHLFVFQCAAHVYANLAEDVEYLRAEALLPLRCPSDDITLCRF